MKDAAILNTNSPKDIFCIFAFVYMMLDPIRESRNAKRGLYIQQWAGGEVT